METIQLLPKAESLIESLRDIGYTFESAVADIIDNSITAGSKNIKIYFDFKNGELILAIIDDGIGMNRAELIEAMRPGSKNPLDEREKNDLGRFGLGLKTASFSQCRKLTVISSQRNIFSGARWDLDFVSKKHDWSLQLLDNNEILDTYKINTLKENGTFVLWENTDRIIDNSVVSINEEIVYQKIEILQKHLELVFHKFLQGKNKVNIFINDNPLKAFDPFHSSHTATQELPEEVILIDDKKIEVKPYILPHYSKVSVQDYEYYAGDGGYLKNQGFYVYRNNRLLISGTWFRIIPQSEMYKLARIEINLPNNLDDLWKIDVKKSYASPPVIIRERLKKIVDKISGASTRIYTSRGHSSKKITGAFWERNSKNGEIKYLINKQHPLINEFIGQLTTEQSNEFNKIINLIGNFFPKDTLYSDIGNNNPNNINKIEITDEELEDMSRKIIIKEGEFISNDEFYKYFKSTEPFNIYKKDWKTFIENMEK